MARGVRLRFESRLACTPAVLWHHLTTLDGINRELAPFRLEVPADAQDLEGVKARLEGDRPFSNTLRLGELPLITWEPHFEELDGMGFVEASPMPGLAHWRHERKVEADGDGCKLVDTVELVPQVPGTLPVAERLVRTLFTHRHQRLAKLLSDG